MSRDNSGPSLGDVVSAAALVLGLITAWLYVTGWTYAYHYFDKFRIPMLMTELPREHLFVYGGLVLWKNPVVTGLVALALFVLISACVRYRARLRRFGVSTVMVVTILLLFVGGRFGAIATAEADFAVQRAEDDPAYPRVRFSLEDSISSPKDVLADLPASDCGRLVLATSDRLFLIRPVAGASGTDLDTFVVPRDDLKSIRIKADYASCP
jgi:hypothetical protein